jgi:putative ABC transport system substrate-binding protein
MRRRRFLKGITGAAALSVAPSPAWAQKLSAKRIYGITARGKTPVEQGFIDEISRFGLPADIIWRDANQDMTKIPGFVREIQELKPDLVYTWGTPLTLNVAGAYDSVDRSRHVTGIPIVFANVASPVGAKIVASLKGQGRDVTGVFHVAALATQLEAMRAYKTFSKIGFLYDKSQANMVAIASDLRSLARAQGFSLIEQIFDQDVDGKPVGTGAEAKVTKLKQLGAEWLYLGPDTFALSQLGRIAPVAIEVGLPAFGAT